MIEKPSIIITSLGRTGTTFFASLFENIIPDCDSFHEPDIVQYFGTRNRVDEFFKRVKDAGVYNMIFLKSIGKWSLIKLSDDRFTGKANYSDTVRKIFRQRANFVISKKGSVYVESNAGYYGLIDVLPSVFRNHRVVFLIRNARDWISSAMKVNELYAPKKGLRSVFAHKMPTAVECVDDSIRSSWNQLSRFTKLCWAWSRLNMYALDTVSKNPYARAYKFEDIFLSNGKYHHLNNLVSFATSLPIVSEKKIGNTDGWLENKVNQSSGDFDWWKELNQTEKRHFEEMCGPLMERLGYKI